MRLVPQGAHVEAPVPAATDWACAGDTPAATASNTGSRPL